MLATNKERFLARSGFVTAFEGFWNTWACHRHGRTTREIHLSPFTLKECEEFYRSRGVKWFRYDIAQSYMVMGGIPYYMKYVEKGMSKRYSGWTRQEILEMTGMSTTFSRQQCSGIVNILQIFFCILEFMAYICVCE